jgi:hypothetical protein
LGLAAAALAPIAALPVSRWRRPDEQSLDSWLATLLYPTAAAAALAALTTGPDYALRIEEYRGLNLDWALPAAAASLALPNAGQRVMALAAVAAGWLVAHRQRLDPLAAVDPAHAQGHTHHISAAQRLAGDLMMAIGPRPARKWAGLGPAAGALALALRRADSGLTAGATTLSLLGNMLALVGYRRPERALAVTSREALPSQAVGALIGLLILLLGPDGGE